MKRLLIVMVVGVAGLCDGSGAATRPKITGIYSDMKYNDEGSDVLGMELFIVFTSRGYAGVFQSSEGVPTFPVVVPVAVQGTQIEFTLPSTSAYTGKFVGTIADEGITGRFASGQLGSDDKAVVRLRRGKSYWQ